MLTTVMVNNSLIGKAGAGEPSKHQPATRVRSCSGLQGRHRAGTSLPLWDQPEQPFEPPENRELAFASKGENHV